MPHFPQGSASHSSRKLPHPRAYPPHAPGGPAPYAHRPTCTPHPTPRSMARTDCNLLQSVLNESVTVPLSIDPIAILIPSGWILRSASPVHHPCTMRPASPPGHARGSGQLGAQVNPCALCIGIREVNRCNSLTINHLRYFVPQSDRNSACPTTTW